MSRVIERPTIAIAPPVAVSRFNIGPLELFLYIHLCLVIFQIPLRGALFDTTFYRDIFLIASVAIWGLAMLRQRTVEVKKPLNTLDRIFVLYIAYGVVSVVVAVINQVAPLDAILQFRNNFLPAALYFVAKKTFETREAQSRLVNLFLVLTLVLIADVIGEYIVRLAGYSPSTIPWYPYIFRTNPRFIGNEVFAKGYILPEHSPVLGVLGYPHYTVATLMALFAFSYPFFLEKRLGETIGGGSWLVPRVPARLRQLIGPLAIIAVFILGVRSHLVSIVLVLMVLPFFTHPKVLLRNILILSFASAFLVLVGLLESSYVETLRLAFFGGGTQDSVLSVIFSLDEVKFIANSPFLTLLFGNADTSSQVFGEVGNFELRLLFFTAAFGLVWLIMFLSMFAVGALYARRVMFASAASPVARLFAIGVIGALGVYFLDMGHYARTMWAPNIDIWMMMLGTTSAVISQLAPEKREPIVPSFVAARRRLTGEGLAAKTFARREL